MTGNGSKIGGALAADGRSRWTRRALLGAAATVPLAVVAHPSGRVGGQGFSATPTARGDASPVGTAPVEPGLRVIREQRPTDPGSPVVGGELRLLRPPASRDDFSPVSLRQDFQVLVGYLDPLLRPDEVTLEPLPWLAERWEWSERDRVITYTLRRDIVFHDGSPLSAIDVAFSFSAYRDDVDSAVRNQFSAMQAAEALDDRTLRVTLAEPDGAWLFAASTQLVFQRGQYAAYWESRPVGERTLTGFDWASSLPVGTGPWRIAEWDERRVAFARNDRYWAGPPAFERLSVGWEAEPDDRLAAWRASEVDLLWPISASDAESVAEEEGRLYVADAAAVMFAAFNFANPTRPHPGLFADVDVRRALSLAINRDRYAADVFGGFVRQRAAGTVAQPWANDPELTTPRQDSEAASDLLAAAGWRDLDGDGTLDDAFGQRFAISVILRDDARPELAAVLRSARRDLAEIGVELAVQPLGLEEFARRWLEVRDFDLIAFAYDLYPGFTDFDLYGSAWDVRTNPQGFNPGGYANEAVDRLIGAVLAATDIETQRSLLRELQRETDDDLFALWLGFPRQLVLAAPDIRGFQPNKVWQTADTRKLWREEVGRR